MVEAGRSPNVEILTLAKVKDVQGKAGNFTVQVELTPRYIDPDKCTACGECMKYCPSLAIDAYNAELTFTRAARIDFSQAIPTAYYIDRDKCLRLQHEMCQLCANVCGPKAIDFEQKPEIKELQVEAILLAPGFSNLPKSELTKYGYGIYPDVLTSMEVERITCVAGPTQGEVIRPSDGKHPHKIAYLQCIGSRDTKRGYCSSVCCMFALKQATVIKEHAPDVDIDLFYMDIRTQGKGFDQAFSQAVAKHNFKVIRSRPGKIEQVGKQIALSYVDERGDVQREFYDLVVLSTGLCPPEDAQNLAKKFGFELNEFQFAQTDFWNNIQSSLPGVLVVGAFQGPKDVPESVVQASGGAGLISELLAKKRFQSTVVKTYPQPDPKLLSQDLRVGVFVCHCGVNIAGTVKVKKVIDGVKDLPDVVLASEVVYACSQDFLERLKQEIHTHRLNRVVIAACSPRTHEPLFQDTLREAGLNPGLFEMANIRDHCAWVHAHEPELATVKAIDTVKMAIAKARTLSPVQGQEVAVRPAALVIGGGVAGLTASLSVAEQGFEVFLLEKEKELGGLGAKLAYGSDLEPLASKVKELINQVKEHPQIKVYTQTELVDLSGYVGNFTAKCKQKDKEITLEHGVIIIATGARSYQPACYPWYGKKIITQWELANKLGDKRKLRNLNQVVMIQCAGSRGQELGYCSKMCCAQAVGYSLLLKKVKPELEVIILYQDLRTYGLQERYFLEARKQGIKFIRYHERPQVEKDKTQPKVRVYDPVLGEELEFEPDLVVLSTGVKPEKNEELFNLLKLSTNQDGFLMEAHVKLRPVETVSDGMYVCGLAHSPKPFSEVRTEARAAAAKACIPLAKGKIEVSGIVATVEEKKCIGCGICVEACPFGAISLEKVDKRKKAKVVTALCKGCGMCAASCPVFAVDVAGFKVESLVAQIKGFGVEG